MSVSIMKKLEVRHKGILYSFEYMERSDRILVIKGEVPHYEIKVIFNSGAVTFNCNCPGSTWHGYCWHLDGDMKAEPPYSGPEQIITQDSLEEEPWVEWAEEAALMEKEKDERKVVRNSSC